MSERCDKTDLPVDQCAGACCRPDLAKAEAPGQVEVRVRFTARFNSPCDFCDERIREGEPMAFGPDDSRVCKRHLIEPLNRRPQ